MLRANSGRLPPKSTELLVYTKCTHKCLYCRLRLGRAEWYRVHGFRYPECRLKTLRQFCVLALLLVSCMAPAMACMVPGAQMSNQERACCRMMKNQCGQMEMPALHGCCQKTPPSAHYDGLDTKAVALHPVVVSVISLTASELVNPTSTVAGWVDHPDYSPPKSPPSTISILRI
jgi:hypothetical protein